MVITKEISADAVSSKIYLIRGRKVMLDEDLATWYEVPTKRINEQVKRNPERFPEDFMFQLTNKEFGILKSQNATASWGGRRTLPYAFTEHGVLMLSSVLKSPKAVQVNIRIMRVFIKMREMIASNEELVEKVAQLESLIEQNELDIVLIFEFLKNSLVKKKRPEFRSGFF